MLTVAALGAALGLVAAGCESTQDKAARIQAEGEALVASQKPLEIAKPNKDVEVVDTALLNDEFGTAAVVAVRNPTKETLVGVPILVDVRNAKGNSVFRNDAFGLDFALNHIPLLRPGETFYWVNDQILANGDPRSVKVTVGQPEGEAPAQIPEIRVSDPKLTQDPSGVQASGTVDNESDVDQRKLVLFAVARRGGQVVAAGRGALKKLRSDQPKPGTYNIFFIGDPAGADVIVTAPPSTLEQEGSP